MHEEGQNAKLRNDEISVQLLLWLRGQKSFCVVHAW